MTSPHDAAQVAVKVDWNVAAPIWWAHTQVTTYRMNTKWIPGEQLFAWSGSPKVIKFEKPKEYEKFIVGKTNR